MTAPHTPLPPNDDSSPGVAPPSEVPSAPSSFGPDSQGPRSSSFPLEAGGGGVVQEAFPGERPAAEHLSSGTARSDWERRAEWLEAEARGQPEAAARGRLLLAASEIRSLLGAHGEARRLAEQASSQAASPGFAARQARALGLAQHDYASVLANLADEARAARAPATRAHAHYVAAEIQRLLLHDDTEVEQRLEAAEQSDPTDHRPTLQRLARQLARNQRPPDVRFRADDSLRPLRHATGQLRQLRGSEAPRLGAHDLAAQPLVEAQRALGRGRWSEAADALQALDSQPGLRAAVRWLTLLWRVVPKAEPEELLSALERLAREHPGRVERRALAGRALATGQWERLRSALDANATPGESVEARPNAPPSARATSDSAVFSNIERAALRALAGWPKALAPHAGADPHDHPAEELARGALDAAGARLGGPSPTRAPVPSAAASEFALGLALGTRTTFEEAAPLFAALKGSPWILPLRLERSRAAGDLAALASELPGWSGSAAPDPVSEFVAGVLAECAGDPTAAAQHYRSIPVTSQLAEAALRPAVRAASDDAANFCALAARTPDGTRRALLLVEALFQMPPEASDFNSLAEAAWRADPELPLGAEIGELGARMRADRFELGRWLGRQREAAAGADERTLAAVREARFLALGDAELAARLFREIAPPDTNDLVLQRELERLSLLPALDQARFRARAAQSASPRRREHLLAEAAELFRAAGDTAASLAAARELRTALGPLYVETWATEPEDRARIHARWAAELVTLSDEAVDWDRYERLSRNDPAWRNGERGQQLGRHWQEDATLPLAALRWLELESMARGREQELEHFAARHVELLSGPDVAAHAFLAARLLIDRGAFTEARPFAARAAALTPAPLWALRLEQAHARAAGDDRLLLACCHELSERSSQPLDAATLALRAAEAALRLGQIDRASLEAQRAFEIAPDQIAVLATRAELLRRKGQHAEAAEAFETLAAATESPPRRAEAAFEAAKIWLDVLGDRQRGLSALEHAATLEPAHPDALDRWQSLQATARVEPAPLEPAPVEPTPEPALPATPNYAELVSKNPDDADARRQWIGELIREGRTTEAVVEQRELLERSPNDDERREALLGLVELLDQTADGAAEAEALIERAQRSWPEHARVLEVQVDHYRRRGNADAAHALLERTTHATRNAVHAGRLEPELFRLLELALRLQADPESARAAQGALAAIEGQSLRIPGAGSQAGQLRFDDLIAPAPLSAGFRRLLYGAGAAIERAYALEPGAVPWTPLPEAQTAQVRAVASAFGLDNVRAGVSSELGCECTTLFAEPRVVIFGQPLLEHEDARVRDFLLLRALKIAQVNACALSRMSPNELWSAIAGFLACFAPPWAAEGLDAQRLVTARNRIRPHVTAILSSDLAAMTPALTANVVPQVALVGDALWRWASRVAFLGVGELGVALSSLWATSNPRLPPPKELEGRVRWIASSSHARDLVGYGISEAYTEARRRAGLVTTPR